MTARAGIAVRPRGGPLVMLVLLLAGWSAARAMWWENPYKLDLPLTAGALPSRLPDQSAPMPLVGGGWAAPAARMAGAKQTEGARRTVPPGPRRAAAQPVVRFAAPAAPMLPSPGTLGAALAAPAVTAAPEGSGGPAAPASAPFLPASPAAPASGARGGRWSVDGWAFWRQGSDAAPVSLGRVPVYGASQAGAVLQYRLAPGTARDPRIYARAYRALVRRGENELALGVSARPLGWVPVRMAGEVRYTDAAFRNSVRPAVYAVTELPPIALPYGAQVEAYGQAGWVGGPGATGFADGQVSLTGELRPVGRMTGNAVRLSIGAAAWGGTQRDARRIDIGPTLRLDLMLGAVPARLSVDWRERVGGDAAPVSGLAATLSTGF